MFGTFLIDSLSIVECVINVLALRNCLIKQHNLPYINRDGGANNYVLYDNFHQKKKEKVFFFKNT